MHGDETTGYCLTLFKPCSCKDESIHDELLYSVMGACQEEIPVTEFICVPGYEKCLSNYGTAWCLPSFVKKPDECEDGIWNKLQEKFGDPYKFDHAPPVVPCFNSDEPTPDNPIWNEVPMNQEDDEFEQTGDDSEWNM